ncbi:MAG: RNA pyrophosphohydrolase [Thalassobaculum sp.]|uniref:RNA pyrophosphohydrolase n=1 Tax=Thalassobaculum sp. TaxID=2022740 RepID=UPI0032EA9461
MTAPDSLPYRPCVGIMLFDARGRVFVGRRIDTPDAWQMPQGGIDDGEAPEAAALRELEEEIGTAAAVIEAGTAGWLTYDLPGHLVGKLWGGRWRGQRQKWFACRFTGTDQDIRLDTAHPEFDAWRWVGIDELTSLIVPFKKAIYAAVIEELGPAVRQRAAGTSQAERS